MIAKFFDSEVEIASYDTRRLTYLFPDKTKRISGIINLILWDLKVAVSRKCEGIHWTIEKSQKHEIEMKITSFKKSGPTIMEINLINYN